MISRAFDIAQRAHGAGPQVIYVYGFVGTHHLPGLTDARDTGEPVVLHRSGAISAVIRRVPREEFCGPDAEANLSDPVWLMPRIRHHEAVVESAMGESAIFPTGFATLFSGLDNVTAFMRRHEATIASFCRDTSGHQEWGLKVTAELDDAAMLDALAGEFWPDWSGYAPGKRYLRLRQERPVLLRAAGERASAAIRDLVDGLRPFVTSIRLRARPAPDETATRYVEDYALLVTSSARAALCDRLNRLLAEQNRQRLQAALSGPWPPYSFRPVLEEKGLRTDG
jgi:hypothetical protein